MIKINNLKYLPILIIPVMILSLISFDYEKSIIKKSYLLEDISAADYLQSVHYINSSTLVLNSKYLIHLKEKDVSVQKIKWDNDLFADYSEIKLLSDHQIIGRGINRYIVTGDLNNYECKTLYPKHLEYKGMYDTDEEGSFFSVGEHRTSEWRVLQYNIETGKIIKRFILDNEVEKIIIGKDSLYAAYRFDTADIYSIQSKKRTGALIDETGNYSSWASSRNLYNTIIKGSNNDLYLFLSYSRKGLFFSGKDLYNSIVKIDKKENRLKYLIRNKSEISFWSFDVYDGIAVLIYEYNENVYLYKNKFDEFVKDFDRC